MNGCNLNFSIKCHCICIQVQICFRKHFCCSQNSIFTHFTPLFFNSALKNGVCDIFPRHALSKVNHLIYQEFNWFLFKSVENKKPIFILISSKKIPADKILLGVQKLAKISEWRYFLKCDILPRHRKRLVNCRYMYKIVGKNDCCCEKRALNVSKLHNFITIQDTDMYDTWF